MSRLGRRIWRWVAAALATVAILMALAVGAVRIALPLLPEYRDQLEAAASRVAGTTVEVGELDARWLLSGPELVVEGVTVMGPGGDTPFLRFERVSLVISLWPAITRGEIVPSRVVVSGVDLELERGEDRTWRLNGRALEELIPEGRRTVPDMEVALEQARLAIRDRQKDVGPWRLEDIELEGEVGQGYRNLRLFAVPGARLGDYLEFAYQSSFDGTGPARSDIYLEAEGVSIADLAALRLPEGIRAREGRADILLWAELDGDRVQRLDTTLSVADLGLAVSTGEAAPRELQYPALDGRLAWDRTGSGWRLVGSGISAHQGGRERENPESSFSLEATEAPGRDPESGAGQGAATTLYYGEADFVALDDLVPLLGLIPDPEQARTWLARSPEGRVSNLVFQGRMAGDGQPVVSLRGSFEDVGMQPVAGLPGFQGLDGAVSLTDNSGDIGVTAEDVRFLAPDLFRETLALDRLIGSLSIDRRAERWEVASHGFTVENPDVRARGRLDLSLGGEAPPEIDLQVRAYDMDLRTKSPYLPAGIMSEAVVGWLDRAVVSGSVAEAGLILRGPLDRFPFSGNEGKFEIRFGFEDTRLDFADDWPAAVDLRGEAVFAGPGLEVTFDGGRVGALSVEDARAGFRDLGDGILTVDAGTQADVAGYLAFLRETPLHRRFGAYLDRLSGTGPGDGGVRLEMDVGDVESVSVDGELVLAGAELAVEGAPEPLRQLDGTLNFTESAVSAEALRGRLFGWPARLEIVPAFSDPDGELASGTLVRLTGSADGPVISELAGEDLSDFLEGDFDWVAEAVMPETPRRDGTPSEIRLTSMLAGLTVDLPPPLRKPSAEPMPGRMVIRLGDSESPGLGLDGRLGERLRFLAEFEPGSREGDLALAAASVAFGGESPRLPDRGGLTVSGAVEHLPVDAWLGLAPDAEEDRALLRGVALQVGRLEALGQSYRDTYLMVNRSGREWLVRLESEDAFGTLVVPVDGRTTPIIADFERLVLATDDEEEAAEDDGAAPPDPRELPGLRFTAEDFVLGPSSLGHVELDLAPVQEGLRLMRFSAGESAFSLEGSGGWFLTEEGHRSELAITMTSTEVAESLTALGYEGSLEAAWGELILNLSWEDAPTGEVLSKLDGTARIRIEDGQLRAVKPGAGRIFGLLSLNSLPRRLLLDFSDFFSEGLSFDTITGSYTIEDGDAYTEDLALKGPAADIGIVGRTGLAARDYDQTAVVSGNFRSSLPVAGALAGGAGVGAALLVFSQIFKDELKDATKVQYRITGDWESPDVERVAVVPRDQDGTRSSDGSGGAR